MNLLLIVSALVIVAGTVIFARIIVRELFSRMHGKRACTGIVIVLIILGIFFVNALPIWLRPDRVSTAVVVRASPLANEAVQLSPAMPKITPTARPTPSINTREPKKIVFKRAPTPPPETLALLSPKPSISPSASPEPEPTKTPAQPESVKKGDRGNQVIVVQTHLVRLGFLVGEIDGIFGNHTEQAVRSFQKANGLPETGVVDGKTRAILVSYAAIAVSPTPRKTQNPGAGKDYRKNASEHAKYVINTNTGKFHRATCRYVKKIKPSNYREYTGSRDDLVARGYVPCKVCSP